MNKLILSLIMLFSIGANAENMEVLLYKGGVIESKSTDSRIFLSCIGDCVNVDIMIEYEGEIRTLGRANTKKLKKSKKKIAKEAIANDSERYRYSLLSATANTITSGAESIEEDSKYLPDAIEYPVKDLVENSTIATIIYMAPYAAAGVATDIVKSPFYGLYYSVRRVFAKKRAKSILKHLLKSSRVGEVKRIGHADFYGLRDALHGLNIN